MRIATPGTRTAGRSTAHSASTSFSTETLREQRLQGAPPAELVALQRLIANRPAPHPPGQSSVVQTSEPRPGSVAANPAAAAASPQPPLTVRIRPVGDDSAAQWNQVLTAVRFLDSLTLGDVFQRLEANLAPKNEMIHIRVSTRNAASFSLVRDANDKPVTGQDRVRGVIEWNPFLGLRLQPGVVVTPAEVLRHEAAHALNSTDHLDQFQVDTARNAPRVDGFTNAEEKAVIENIDNPGAALVSRAIGRTTDPVRRDHSEGAFVPVEGPTSATESARQLPVIEGELTDARGRFQRASDRLGLFTRSRITEASRVEPLRMLKAQAQKDIDQLTAELQAARQGRTSAEARTLAGAMP